MAAGPFTIIGAGAIGGILGAHLVEAGHAVTFVEANPAHRGAIRARGLKVTGAVETVVKAPVLSPDELPETLSQVLLAVKSPHTEAAISPLAGRLAADGFIVSLQNGLNEYTIAAAFGPSRTIGAYLTFGGFVQEPGHVVFAGPGTFKLGELDGTVSPRVEALASTFSCLQPVTPTGNIFGYLWAKMALGAVYYGTAIIGEDVPVIYADERARAVLGRLAGEVVAVAERRQVTLESCDGFDPKAFRQGAGDAAAIDAAWEAQRRYWGRHTNNARTGIWRDLAIHRRKTEVDAHVGPIVAMARAANVPVPGLETLHRLVRAIEGGQRTLGWTNLDELASVYGGRQNGR